MLGIREPTASNPAYFNGSSSNPAASDPTKNEKEWAIEMRQSVEVNETGASGRGSDSEV
jgi:hypothetical protein